MKRVASWSALGLLKNGNGMIQQEMKRL